MAVRTRLTTAGVISIALGLVVDVTAHRLAAGHSGTAGSAATEHLAHLVVLIGMVLVLAGVVADGLRGIEGRASRPEGSPRDAVR